MTRKLAKQRAMIVNVDNGVAIWRDKHKGEKTVSRKYISEKTGINKYQLSHWKNPEIESGKWFDQLEVIFSHENKADILSAWERLKGLGMQWVERLVKICEICECEITDIVQSAKVTADEN